jgi:hypothetical protein
LVFTEIVVVHFTPTIWRNLGIRPKQPSEPEGAKKSRKRQARKMVHENGDGGFQKNSKKPEP